MDSGSDSTAGVPVGPATPYSLIGTRALDKKILIITPWYKSAHPITANAVANLADKRRCQIMLNFGDAFVIHSRNKCVEQFLKSSMEWALWIDDDMVVPWGNSAWFRAYTGWGDFPDPFAGFNAIDRLLAAKKTVVGATYWGRHPGAGPVYNEGSANPAEREYCWKGPYDVVKPTAWVGTGCLLTHRSAFEDIEKRFPNIGRGSDGKGGNWFSPTEHNLMRNVNLLRDMLTDGPMTSEKSLRALTMVEGALSDARANSGLSTGEDVTFCRRAAQCGHQPHVDLGLWCGHIGHLVYPGGRWTKKS